MDFLIRFLFQSEYDDTYPPSQSPSSSPYLNGRRRRSFSSSPSSSPMMSRSPKQRTSNPHLNQQKSQQRISPERANHSQSVHNIPTSPSTKSDTTNSCSGSPIKGRKLRFAQVCSVVLIPTRHEFKSAGCDLWYESGCFTQFAIEARDELLEMQRQAALQKQVEQSGGDCFDQLADLNITQVDSVDCESPINFSRSKEEEEYLNEEERRYRQIELQVAEEMRAGADFWLSSSFEEREEQQLRATLQQQQTGHGSVAARYMVASPSTATFAARRTTSLTHMPVNIGPMHALPHLHSMGSMPMSGLSQTMAAKSAAIPISHNNTQTSNSPTISRSHQSSSFSPSSPMGSAMFDPMVLDRIDLGSSPAAATSLLSRSIERDRARSAAHLASSPMRSNNFIPPSQQFQQPQSNMNHTLMMAMQKQ